MYICSNVPPLPHKERLLNKVARSGIDIFELEAAEVIRENAFDRG